MGQRGRPKRKDSRDKGVRIRLTEAELDIFREVAKAHDMSIAEYVRKIVFKEYQWLLEKKLDERNFRGIL